MDKEIHVCYFSLTIWFIKNSCLNNREDFSLISKCIVSEYIIRNIKTVIMNFGQGIALAAHDLQNQLCNQNNSSYFQMNLCLYCKKILAIFDSQRKKKMKRNYQNTCDDAFC